MALIKLPDEIEKKSFEIITNELGNVILQDEKAPIIKRVIHTTADFEYARSLYFSSTAIQSGREALKNGCSIVTDTTMALSGINKSILNKLGVKYFCFVSDSDIMETSIKEKTTRAAASIDKASKLEGELVFVVGNAPTALIRIAELIEQGQLNPALVIAAPVGFVNIIESKDKIISCQNTPMIVSTGRKGGSNVAAAIMNALLLGIEIG